MVSIHDGKRHEIETGVKSHSHWVQHLLFWDVFPPKEKSWKKVTVILKCVLSFPEYYPSFSPFLFLSLIFITILKLIILLESYNVIDRKELGYYFGRSLYFTNKETEDVKHYAVGEKNLHLFPYSFGSSLSIYDKRQINKWKAFKYI